MPQKKDEYHYELAGGGRLVICTACRSWSLSAANGLAVLVESGLGPHTFGNSKGYWGRLTEEGAVACGYTKPGQRWNVEDEIIGVSCGSMSCLRPLEMMPGVVKVAGPKKHHAITLCDGDAMVTLSSAYTRAGWGPTLFEDWASAWIMAEEWNRGDWLSHVGRLIAQAFTLKYSDGAPEDAASVTPVDARALRATALDAAQKITRATGLPREE